MLLKIEAIDENALGMTDSRLSSDQHRDLDYAVRGDSAYTFGNDPYAMTNFVTSMLKKWAS
jgi:hypothetical protein